MVSKDNCRKSNIHRNIFNNGETNIKDGELKVITYVAYGILKV
jgi:hypothetical protein